VWSTVEFARSKTPVVKDISFEFNNNEKVAVIGRVGCGKSTVFNCILQEAFVTAGQIELGGS